MSKLSRSARATAGMLTASMCAFASRAVGAQTVRGLMADAGGRPVSGVVAMLVDSAATVVARTLSDGSGRYTLTAPHAGAYRIRAIRIGYRPTVTPPLRLTPVDVVEYRVELDALPLSLDTVRVADRGACRQLPVDSTAIVFAAWEQVRGALTAAQLTASRKGVATTTIVFDRTLDPGTSRVRKQSTGVRTEYVREPWRALPVDTLRRNGYVTVGRDDSTTYYAPGLDMLLSPVFVEDHCFRLARGSDAQRLGLEFEPTSARHRVAEIKGTLWLDRASSEFRRLEFRYVNVPPEQADHAGGDLEFVRMAGGGWVISRWSISMPVLERAPASRSFRSRDVDDPALHVAEIQVAGGTLTTVVAGNDTLWSRPPVTLGGIIVDSVSHNVVARSHVSLAGTNLAAVSDERGRFSIPGVLPGAYTAEVRTPALDSLNAVHALAIAVSDSAATLEIRVPTPRQVETALCGTKRLDEPGIITGTVRLTLGDSLPPDARVVATWVVIHLTSGGGGAPVEIRERRSLPARVMADGAFRLCGVPVNTELTIDATGANAESPEPEVVRIPPSMRFARTDVGLARLAAGKAVFSGTVLVDSTAQPVVAADVTLPELQLATRSNESGAFRVGEIPAGDHRVVVRRLGFSPLETVLTFGSGEHVERRFAMARATILDSMRVVADATPRAMLSFEEHRRVGLGHFLTRADLAKVEGQTMGAVLRSLSGVRLVPGTSTQLWAASSRNRATVRTVDLADRLAGARRDCYTTVYVNNAVVYAGRSEEPLFDVNTIRPDQLEAVEYYAGSGETPGEYGTLDSTCGVLVLWTRRTP